MRLKNLLAYLVMAAFIAAIVYVIQASNSINIIDSFIPERLAVFRNVHMSGLEASSEAWEIYAKEAWTGRDKSRTTFEYVTDARIDRGKRILVKDLRARRLIVARNKDIEILKSTSEADRTGYLSAEVDFNAISGRKKPSFSSLSADRIFFNPDKKTAIITGNVLITKDKMRVYSERLSVDLDKNIATFEARSTFTKGASRISGDSAVAYFDKDQVDLSGSIEVRQKNKTASSDRAVYDDSAGTITMSSHVRAVINKLQSLMKEKTAKKYRSEEAKKGLTERTIITCDKLRLSNEKGDCTASGRVLVVQKDKEAKSDRAVYTEADQEIILTGNVSMKKNDSWVRADKVIVAVDKETFEAIGRAETTFKVKKGSKR